MDIKDILVKDIYAWARSINFQGENLTYIRTIIKKYPQCETWGDVLALGIDNKPMRCLSEEIVRWAESGAECSTADDAAYEGLADIPVSAIYKWARSVNFEGDNLTYIRTIRQRYPECVTWGDVLALKIDNASMRGLAGTVSRWAEDICKKNYTVLLENMDDFSNLGEAIHAFTAEFAQHIGGKKHSVFMESFLYRPGHEDRTDLKTIAAVLDLTRARTREIKESLEEQCRAILVDGKEDGGLAVNPAMCEAVQRFRERIGVAVSLDTFMGISGLMDEKSLYFLSRVLSMNISKRDSKDAFPRIVLSQEHIISAYTDGVGKLYRFFRENPVEQRFDFDVKAFVNKTYRNQEEREVFLSFIEHSNEFEWKQNEYGERVVMLKWEYLKFMGPEICRILYDRKIYDNHSALPEDELVDIYNREYGRKFGKTPITVDQLAACHIQKDYWMILVLGKTGYWRLRRSRQETFDTLDDYAKKYISKVSGSDYEGFLEQAKADGYMRIYAADSVEDSFVKNGGLKEKKKYSRADYSRVVFTDEKKSFYREQIIRILNEAGCAMTVDALYEKFSAEYPGEVKQGTFKSWLPQIVEEGGVNLKLGNGRRPSIVAPKGVEADMVTSLFDEIREIVVKDIYLAEGQSLNQGDMYIKYAHLVPNNYSSSTPVLSKVFGNKAFFVKTSGGTRDSITISLTAAARQRAERKYHDLIVKQEQKPALSAAAPRLGYEWESLKKTLIMELTFPFREFSGFGMDKALDNAYRIMKNGKNDLPETSPFYDVLIKLPAHYSRELGKVYDNDLKKDCLGCLEVFFCNFYNLKYGKDLKTVLGTKEPGLYNILSYLETVHGDVPFKNSYDRYTLESKIRAFVSCLHPRRNTQVGHVENVVDKSAMTIEQTIHHTLAVFAYMGSRL